MHKNNRLQENSGNPAFEEMVRTYKRSVSRHSIPECKSRSYFMTKKEAKRIKRGKPRKQSSLQILFEENRAFMTKLGLRINSARNNRQIISPALLEETVIDYIMTEDTTPSEMVEASPVVFEWPIPCIEEYVAPEPRVLQPAQIAKKDTKSILFANTIASKALNFVTVFAVIRFLSETPDQETKFALVWNNDRQWPSFPGGGLEANESLKAAVSREASEETNMQIGVVVKRIGRLPVGANAHVAIFAADLPYSQVGNIKWGIEQRPEWETKLKAVSASFIDRLVSQGRFMPNHIKTWEFYKKYYLKID